MWIPSISGFDSGSRDHTRSERVQRFIYFNKIQHFCPYGGRLSVSIGGCVSIYLIGHIFMMQMDYIISGFDSGSRAHFRSE